MTIITLLDPYRIPYISKVGSSSTSSGLRKQKSNNYDIFVVCGTCQSTKAYSRKHNQYLCPFCDKGGEELLSFPIHKEEIEELEQREEKPLDYRTWAYAIVQQTGRRLINLRLIMILVASARSAGVVVVVKLFTR